MNGSQYWHKVKHGSAIAAPVGVPIEVCGNSGYKACPWYICNAILSDDGRWYGPDCEPLDNRFAEPLYWRRQSKFPTELPISNAI